MLGLGLGPGLGLGLGLDSLRGSTISLKMKYLTTPVICRCSEYCRRKLVTNVGENMKT